MGKSGIEGMTGKAIELGTWGVASTSLTTTVVAAPATSPTGVVIC